MRTALSIAGTDPSGGAGIQADLKTMTMNGVFAMSAITALVAQNTTGVQEIVEMTPEFLGQQIDAVFEDIPPDAVKTGMVASCGLIETIAERLRFYRAKNIVVDPVMVATSGDPLLLPDAAGTLASQLIPYSRVITPNLPEAELLLGHKIDGQSDFEDAARVLSGTCGGKVSVLLKAGHLDNAELTDYFYNAESGEMLRLTSPRVVTANTHGTGCTLSSAIAAMLALGYDLNDAVRGAKKYISDAIKAGADYQIGIGHGPVHHFHRWWK